jgi:hypothetical protein
MTDTALQTLLDKHAIQDALIAYARGIDRRDEALILSAYHPDALDERAGFAGSPQELADWVLPRLAAFDATHHAISTIAISLEGDHAEVEAYFDTHLTRTDPDGRAFVIGSSGRYLDRFERRRGRWAIAARVVVLEQRHELPLADGGIAGMPDLPIRQAR